MGCLKSIVCYKKRRDTKVNFKNTDNTDDTELTYISMHQKQAYTRNEDVIAV